MAQSVAYDPDQVPRGARRALLERTPPGSSVLDVGCWSGFTGRFLGEARGASVDGVEPHAEMASRAACDYGTVLPVPVEQATEQLLATGHRYDVVLFLDVLEHLIEPGEVLRRTRSLVRPGGRVLVSLPNVAHWSVRKELALGRWRYTDSGLLDRTHLRFFTLATARRLAVDSGWRIDYEDSAIAPPPPLRSVPHERLSILGRWPGLFAVQMLFELRPA